MYKVLHVQCTCPFACTHVMCMVAEVSVEYTWAYRQSVWTSAKTLGWLGDVFVAILHTCMTCN